MADIGKAAMELRLGHISAEDFDRSVAANLRGVARRVMRMLRCPSWYTEEDMVQELRLSAWLGVWKFDEDRSDDIGAFVLWAVFVGGKRSAHVARHGKRRKDELTREVPLEAKRGAWLHGGDPEEDEAQTVPAFTEPSQGKLEAHVQELGQACRSDTDRIVIEAVLREGDLVAAARALLRNRRVRRQLGLVGDEHAEEVVHRAAKRVARRLQQEEAA